MLDIVYTFSEYLKLFWDYFRNVIDVVLVAVVLYMVYRFLANTRAIQLLKGVLVIIGVAILAKILRLDTLDWFIMKFAPSMAIAIIILFQPELRRLITQFGQRNWIGTEGEKEPFPLDELVNALVSMSEERVGSLIVIERNTGLRSYAESGVIVNADVSEEFIRTVFFPLTPLHDGAIIIQEGRITAAACYLPLSDSKQLKKQHGARHRAALGIAEETDALVLITSEETGSISIMVNGRFFPKVRVPDLKNMILFFMNPKTAYEEKYRTPLRKGPEREYGKEA
jgi:diadenylate cyclase